MKLVSIHIYLAKEHIANFATKNKLINIALQMEMFNILNLINQYEYLFKLFIIYLYIFCKLAE